MKTYIKNNANNFNVFFIKFNFDFVSIFLFCSAFIQDGLKSGVSDGVIDAAFRKVRKNSIGFHIWKVEVCSARHAFAFTTF